MVCGRGTGTREASVAVVFDTPPVFQAKEACVFLIFCVGAAEGPEVFGFQVFGCIGCMLLRIM